MKRFLYTILAFTSPFILLIGITELCYTTNGGDLNRLGKISIDKNYRNKFQKSFKQQKYFTDFSTINLKEKNSYNFLSIGDSFSQKGGFGYQNYIINDSSSLLNFDTKAHTTPSYNPIDLAFKLVNGDLFNNLHIDYLILQSVERSIIARSENLNYNASITIEELEASRKTLGKNNNSIRQTNFVDYLKFPFYNILYNFSDNAFCSPVFQKNIRKEVFSSNNKLLFYKEDITALDKNNNIELVNNLNHKLNILSNKLKEKGITLLVLPSPDKYDLYYEYITNNTHPKPLFYDYMRNLKKEYIYIDSKKTLKKHIVNGVKDVYFVDDTHWSPIGARIIGDLITDTITEKK